MKKLRMMEQNFSFPDLRTSSEKNGKSNVSSKKCRNIIKKHIKYTKKEKVY